MEGENTALFDMVEERTQSNGFKVRVWKWAAYTVVWRQYSSTGIDIQVTPDKAENKFLPYIYVGTDVEGCPVRVKIQTTSYGDLSINEYRDLWYAMATAVVAAESIEAQFIRNSKQ